MLQDAALMFVALMLFIQVMADLGSCYALPTRKKFARALFMFVAGVLVLVV